MQWSPDANSGFSPAGVNPWLPVNPDYRHGVNVAEQLEKPGSLLSFYQRVLKLRKESKPLMLGDFVMLESGVNEVLLYERKLADGTVRILLNMSPAAQHVDLRPETRINKVLLSNDQWEAGGRQRQVTLAPYQGIVYQ